eukprot:scaffold12312_cov63-Phaeocystis_antarctica.AAC.4
MWAQAAGSTTGCRLALSGSSAPLQRVWRSPDPKPCVPGGRGRVPWHHQGAATFSAWCRTVLARACGGRVAHELHHKGQRYARREHIVHQSDNALRRLVDPGYAGARSEARHRRQPAAAPRPLCSEQRNNLIGVALLQPGQPAGMDGPPTKRRAPLLVDQVAVVHRHEGSDLWHAQLSAACIVRLEPLSDLERSLGLPRLLRGGDADNVQAVVLQHGRERGELLGHEPPVARDNNHAIGYRRDGPAEALDLGGL